LPGLIRSGTSITEANELARDDEIPQTAEYSDTGMGHWAEALANFPYPIISIYYAVLYIVCISDSAGWQETKQGRS
jgi:hypothetical protein